MIGPGPMAEENDYDVVIVGSGLSGTLMASRLAQAGIRTLVVEAGTNVINDLDAFHGASIKIPSAPFPPQAHGSTGDLRDPSGEPVGRPVVLSLNRDSWQDPGRSYYIQNGPLPFASGYERLVGGTTRSWMGIALRMLPSDFRMQERFGQFTDWPIDYRVLAPWYDAAEAALSVAGDAAEQSYAGVEFAPGYAYPQPPLAASWFDGEVGRRLAGLQLDGIDISVRTTPSARRSRASAGAPACEGSASCIPLCPSGARFSPLAMLAAAQKTGNVILASGWVASRLHMGDGGLIEKVTLIRSDACGETKQVRAGRFIVAANAIESVRLLMMSRGGGNPDDGLANASGQLGRNLMDHPMLVTWGLMPEPVGAYRGPLTTSGIEDLRDGEFRRTHSAFRVEIGNVGWNFPMGDPDTTTLDLIRGTNISGLNPGNEALAGGALTRRLANLLSRQFHLSFELEQSPEESNRITLSEQRDGLGLPRPAIAYDLSAYTRAGAAYAADVSAQIHARLGAVDYTDTRSTHPASIDIGPDGSGRPRSVRYFGAGHIGGTFRMGDSARHSVVDGWQRSWDHRNLFIVGSGAFPTFGTANPSLTIAALCLRTVDGIIREFTS
jgi:choline dehydrogenase-like flavoprotein